MTDDPNQPPKGGRDVGAFGVVTEPGTLRLERLLPGPIERVWGYLTDPEKRGRWLAPGLMELQAGGRVDMKFRNAELSPGEKLPDDRKECAVSGQVTRCEPPRLLTYTWNDGYGDLSEVTFELAPRGRDVLMVLTHRRLSERNHIVGVATGWHTHVGILVDILSGREPRPFWSTKIQMEAEYEKRIAK